MESKNSTWEEDMYWKKFNFARFSLFLPHDFHHGLILPKKFTDHMRTQLPEKVVLKVNGTNWNVNLHKGKDDVMFQGDGWQDFAKAYSLKKSDMLMFKYDRFECFEVLIFDQASSCEKEASYFVQEVKQSKSNDCDHFSGGSKETVAEELTNTNQLVNDSAYSFRKRCVKNYGENDENECDEISEENVDVDCTTPRTSNGKRVIEVPSNLRKRKHEYRIVGEKDENVCDEISDEENVDMDCTTPRTTKGKRAIEVPSNLKKRKHEYCIIDEKTTPNSKRAHLIRHKSKRRTRFIAYKSNRRPVTEEEKEKALEKARETSAQYLNSFVVIMRPSCVYSRFYMSIPSEWKMRSFFKKGQEVVLKVKEKIWICKVGVTRACRGFGGGWKSFARENDLEESDVCLFVPTGSKDGRSVLDVSIFRVVPEIVRPSTIVHSDVMEISNENLSEEDNGSDYAKRNKTKVNSGFTSKCQFSGRASNNRVSTKDLSVDDEDESSNDDKSITEENNTPMKDASATKVPFSLSWKNKNSTSKENRVHHKSNSRQITDAHKEWILEIAQKSAAKHQNSFIQVMKPSAVVSHYFMSIPHNWKPRCNLRNGQEVILKFKEKTWACMFCANPSNTGLRNGWKNFVLDNKLEEFDVCMFVPDEKAKGKLVLDITIFRARSDSVE